MNLEQHFLCCRIRFMVTGKVLFIITIGGLLHEKKAKLVNEQLALNRPVLFMFH